MRHQRNRAGGRAEGRTGACARPRLEKSPPRPTRSAALLEELGAGERIAGPAVLEGEARALVEDPGQGDVLIAAVGAHVVGVLCSSWQRAVHVPGRYAVIQDLWVDPAWRSSGVGAGLIEALAAIAREQGAPRLEVGLPRESFAAIVRTEAFYAENGFEHLGPRMRRRLG